MEKIAVWGGTRFFGKQIVKKLMNTNKYIVDVYSRNDLAEYIFNRSDQACIEKALSKEYDIIIDNICFGSADANLVVDYFFENRDKLPKLYVLTSTSFVYKDCKGEHDENIQFKYEQVTNQKYPQISYEEGKRESEYIFENSVLQDRLLIIRPAYVMGQNDHTGRLENMLKIVQNNQYIKINNNDLLKASFVDSDFLSDVVVYLIENQKSGLFNVSNSGCMATKDIYEEIAKLFNKKIIFQLNNTDLTLLHPYSLNQSLCLSIKKLVKTYPYKIESIKNVILKILKESI